MKKFLAKFPEIRKLWKLATLMNEASPLSKQFALENVCMCFFLFSFFPHKYCVTQQQSWIHFRNHILWYMFFALLQKNDRELSPWHAIIDQNFWDNPAIGFKHILLQCKKVLAHPSNAPCHVYTCADMEMLMRLITTGDIT